MQFYTTPSSFTQPEFTAFVTVLLPYAQALQASVTAGTLASDLYWMFTNQSIERAANFGFDVLRVRYEFDRTPDSWGYKRRLEWALLQSSEKESHDAHELRRIVTELNAE